MRSVFLIVYMKLFLWNPLLLFTGDILQGVLLRTEWTVTNLILLYLDSRKKGDTKVSPVKSVVIFLYLHSYRLSYITFLRWHYPNQVYGSKFSTSSQPIT